MALASDQDPGAHPVQLVLLGTAEKNPVPQSVQVVAVSFGACLPGKQEVQDMAPRPDHVPAVQGSHLPLDSDPA